MTFLRYKYLTLGAFTDEKILRKLRVIDDHYSLNGKSQIIFDKLVIDLRYLFAGVLGSIFNQLKNVYCWTYSIFRTTNILDFWR